jgi:small basic protein (TIGR04137 family)
MSIHTSLKVSGKMRGERNVWTRIERLLALKKVGKWSDGQRVVGLPKVRTRFKTKTKKKVKEETAAAPGAAAAEAAPAAAAKGAAPAAKGAAPAAAAKGAAPAAAKGAAPAKK